MNALKRFSGTKSQRDEKRMISLALEHFLLSSILVLHGKPSAGILMWKLSGNRHEDRL